MPPVPDQAQLIARGRQSYAPNYQPREVVFESGLGSILKDLAGASYLDFGSGIGVNCLGHRHPAIVDALKHQAERLWHASNAYFNPQAVQLAVRLTQLTFAQKVYLCNSGTEANEAAIKIARRYGFDQSDGSKHIILTFQGSFHGRTLAAVTATAQPKYHEGFGPLPGGFRYCEFNDIDHLEAQFSDEVCAVLIEPIQGEGGVRPFSSRFMQRLYQLCQANDALLIADEIQCGMGRTGRLFAYQWAPGVVPDIVTVAKAFGAGLPIGAALLGDKTAQTLRLGSHGSTFGGNPICCAVANAVLEQLTETDLLAEISRKAKLLHAGLERINQHLQAFREIRACGLMVGAELTGHYAGRAEQVVLRCLEEKLLVLKAGGNNVIRLLPAYTISDTEIEQGLALFERALKRI